MSPPPQISQISPDGAPIDFAALIRSGCASQTSFFPIWPALYWRSKDFLASR